MTYQDIVNNFIDKVWGTSKTFDGFPRSSIGHCSNNLRVSNYGGFEQWKIGDFMSPKFLNLKQETQTCTMCVWNVEWNHRGPKPWKKTLRMLPLEFVEVKWSRYHGCMCPKPYALDTCDNVSCLCVHMYANTWETSVIVIIVHARMCSPKKATKMSVLVR